MRLVTASLAARTAAARHYCYQLLLRRPLILTAITSRRFFNILGQPACRKNAAAAAAVTTWSHCYRPTKTCNNTTNRYRALSSSSSPDNNKAGERTTTTTQEFDVLIVGGGVVGAALARLLSKQQHPSLTIGLIEAGDSPSLLRQKTVETHQRDGPTTSRIPHPRSYALSPASLEILGLLNGDNNMHHEEQQFFGYYDSMQVWEAGQPASLLMNASDLKKPQATSSSSSSSSSQQHSNFLGCCVEDSVLQNYLWNELHNDNNNVTIFPNTELQDLQLPIAAADTSGETTTMVKGNLMDASLSSRRSSAGTNANTTASSVRPVRTRLLVAADGGNSQIRQAAGMAMASFDYGQTALTFTVELQRSQQQRRRAYQRFLATGPLALLPTYSDQHCVVVWTTTPAEAQQWKHADPVKLAAHLNELFSTGPQQLPFLFQSSTTATSTTSQASSSLWSNLMYGVDKVINTVQYGTAMAAQQDLFNDDNGGAIFQAPPVIANVVSPRFSFPLTCQFPVQRYTVVGNNNNNSCLALIGDAAHTVHPMAGQGLNLGLQDVAALARAIDKAVSSGMDVTTFVGTDYERSRRAQVGLTVAGIHGLQQVFGGQSAVSKHFKSLGMSLIQNVGPVRRALVQAACQGVAVP